MQDEFVQFAQKAFIIKEGKLLIVQKSAKDPVNPFRWDVPGGRKKVFETIDEHIIREVKEEVGIDVVPKNVFDLWSVSLKHKANPYQANLPLTIVLTARFCEYNGDEQDVVIDNDEINEYRWVKIDDNLLEYNFLDGIRHVFENLVKNYNKNKGN